MRRKGRWLAGLFLLLLALSLPLLLNLNVFRVQVHRAVERQLGRTVEFGSLTARLLPRPGMVGQQVKVYEQEDFGAEPFLHAEEVHCDLALRSLWTMRLEFANIHFVRPSVNLVRRSDGAWNLGSFLLTGGDGAPVPGKTPVISATAARINFKLGVDKQVYGLREARLRLTPGAEGRWGFKLQATPFRTDTQLPETGEVRLEGEVGRGPSFSALPFRFRIGLERGSLAQLWALAAGWEPPVRALASLDATLEGTPAEWTGKGTFTIANLRRWDLVAPARTPRWQTEFSFRYVGGGAWVRFEELSVRAERSQLSLAGQVADPLGHAESDLTLQANLALDELLSQWAALKADVSPQVQFDGQARMALTLRGPRENWQGEISAPGPLSLRIPGLPQPVELTGLQLRLDGGKVEMSPLTFHFAPESTLTLRGEFGPLAGAFPYRVQWESAGVRLDPLRRTAAAFGWSLFGPSRWQGQAELNLEWQGQLLGGEEPRWQGEVKLREVKFHPPEFNNALELLEARLAWQGTHIEARPIVARLGENVVTAILERRGRVGQWTVSFDAERLDLDDLDQLVNPHRQGLLARLVGPRQEEARWLQLSAAGEVRVKELIAGPFRLDDLEAQGEWEGGWLDVTRLRFRDFGGRFDGRVQGDFRASPPRYRLAGNLKQVDLAQLLAQTTRLGDLFTGLVGADLALESAGTRPRELRRQLQGRVVAVVHDGTIAPINLFAAMAAAAGVEPPASEGSEPTSLQSLAGEFRVADERVRLDGARIITRRAALELSGSVGFDGQLALRLSGEPLRVAGRRPTPVASQAFSYSYRLEGTLPQPHLVLAEPLPSASPSAP
jgi:uncharacterized protein involved in outer membrane biogenesis